MSSWKLLEVPAIYNLKTRLFSLGRANVWRYLETLPRLPPSARILDVGCGTGRHAEIFGRRLFGVDIIPDYIAHATRHHPGMYCTMDANALGFSDASFDLVYAVGLFHHLNESDAELAASEIVRVLRPGGTALIIDAVVPRPWNPIGYVLAQLDRGEFMRPFDRLASMLHARGFEPVLQNLPGSYPYERAVFRLRKSE